MEVLYLQRKCTSPHNIMTWSWDWRHQLTDLCCSFRLKCHWLCNHAYFGNLVLLCILVSSVMLAAEDPLNSNSERNKVTAVTSSFHPSPPHFSDTQLLRLLLYNNIYNRVSVQNNRVRVPVPPRQLLQERVQHAGPRRGGRQPHLIRVQVGQPPPLEPTTIV